MTAPKKKKKAPPTKKSAKKATPNIQNRLKTIEAVQRKGLATIAEALTELAKLTAIQHAKLDDLQSKTPKLDVHESAPVNPALPRDPYTYPKDGSYFLGMLRSPNPNDAIGERPYLLSAVHVDPPSLCLHIYSQNLCIKTVDPKELTCWFPLSEEMSTALVNGTECVGRTDTGDKIDNTPQTTELGGTNA